MSRIISLRAENVKRLRAVYIEPNGNLVQIRGRNAQGKSSVLDSIFLALGGKEAFPAVPVRTGEEQAFVQIELEDMRITRKITAEGRTTLKVEGKDGEKFSSPQTMLDKLVAGLSFDPLEFVRMKKADRLATLQALVGLDFTELNAERALRFEERTLVGREVRRMEGELTGVPSHEDAPDREVSNAALVAELETANQLHVRGRTLANDAQRAGENARRLDERARAAVAEAERLLAEAEALEAERRSVDEAAERLDAESRQVLSVAPDVAAIHARMRDADAQNTKVRDNVRHVAIRERIEAEREKYRALSLRVEAIDADKVAQLAAAKYPLTNMSMTEYGVLLNGLPFEQASQAEQLRASVAMGMALNPELRVLLVRDGSVLDEDSLRIVAEMAVAWGGQVWLEYASSNREGPGVLIEDGSVVEVEEVAAE